MFFARTLSWLGVFPRFTSVTCFRTFLHLCSCSTSNPARHLAENTLFPQSQRCDWPHFVIFLEVFILWRTFASWQLTHLLWILRNHGFNMVRWRRTFCSACLLMWRNTVQWLTLALWWRYEKKCAVGYAVPNRISEGLGAYRIIDCGAAKDIYRETNESTYNVKAEVVNFTVSIIN